MLGVLRKILGGDSEGDRAAAAEPKVDWHLVQPFLDARDHYTREAIQRDFARDPRGPSVAVDATSGWFVTPVANRRYSVVWQDRGDQLEVQGVVLAQFDPRKAGHLEAQVEQALKRQALLSAGLSPT